MDKVKAIFYAVFVKHQFWTISLVLVAIGIGAWYMAAGKLKSDYTTNKSQIETAKTELDTVRNKPVDQVFNTASHEGMEKMNAARRKEVFQAWLQKYQKQKQDVLVWPPSLSKRFVDRITEILSTRTKNGTIEEVKIVAAEGDPLVFNLREEYRDQIKFLLPQLAEMIGAEWAPQAADVVRRPEDMMMDEMAKKKPVVIWNPSNQTDIQSNHFDWAKTDSQMGEQKLPSTIEILYSMEDYWVLKALMQIIARTNVDEVGRPVTRPDMASIREIYAIQIGQKAADRAGSIYKLAPTDGDPAAAAAQVPPTPTQTPTTPTSPVPGAETGANPLVPGAAAAIDPAERRYVDIAYQPLAAEKVRSAADADNPDEAYLAVAKRVPVRLSLRIDQRKLNKFLIECGNADLMLEVIQVRVLPKEDVFALAGTGGRSGGQFGGGGFGGGGFGGGIRGPEFGGGAVPMDDDRKAHIWDIDVEVYGIIYIFNPPSVKRLTNGLDEAKATEFLTWATDSQKSQTSQEDALNTPSADPPSEGAETAPPKEGTAPAAEKAPPAEAEAKPPAATGTPAAAASPKVEPAKAGASG